MFFDGLVGTVRVPDGDPEVIDLATGERLTYELITPEGVRYASLVQWPEVDGSWGLDLNNEVTRWEGDQLVERYQLEGSPVAGYRYQDWWAIVSEDLDGGRIAQLMSLERGASGLAFTVPAPNAISAHRASMVACTFWTQTKICLPTIPRAS